MAGMKRVIITEEGAVKALNLMSAVSGEDASLIAAQAVMALWKEKAESVLSEVRQLSPLRHHVTELDQDENEKPENTEKSKT